MAINHQIFTPTLLAWYDMNGRKNLPWQHPKTAYRIWISEIMLQQTQVKTAIPYFVRFIERFSDVYQLASASEDEVLAHWSGLGYYSRARNIHKTAQLLCNDFQGEFPQEVDVLKRLPGIGPSTAAAIASLAFNKPTAILDGNVKRVLSRYFLIAGPPSSRLEQQLWQLANACMPDDRCADYTQAIMDMGATCCTPKNPNCGQCPLANTCQAHQTDAVAHYPQKKIKRALPVKKEQFILMHSPDNRIYLEKRPPTGIWGGLWSLPSIAEHDCPTAFIRKTYQAEVSKTQAIMAIKHSFSHFHLHISALATECRFSVAEVAEMPGRWFGFDEIDQLGLSSPMAKIIAKFSSLCSTK